MLRFLARASPSSSSSSSSVTVSRSPQRCFSLCILFIWIKPACSLAGAARLCPVFLIQRHMESSCATGNSRPGKSGSVHHGSARHGQVDEDSKPLCSPCSFFHGSDGCRRGEACRHCHLCPSKEQKRRKRMTRALGFKAGRLRRTVPPIDDNFCAGQLSWSPWLVLWLSSEGKTSETTATEAGVNGIEALLEFGVDDAGVDSTA